MVDILLSKSLTQQCISIDPAILHAAIHPYTILEQLVKPLISYGATVDGVDECGYSPLYYVCSYGHHQIFQCLVDAGADICTLYEPVGSGDLEGLGESSDGKVNLLQIALDFCLKNERRGTITSIWEGKLRGNWGPIIKFLLDTGLRVAPDNPSLVKLLHIFCFQGHLDYLEMLLAVEADINARAGRSDSRDHICGSALHAAVAGRHAAIVERLLEHGADPRIKRLVLFRRFISGESLTPVAMACRSPSRARAADMTRISLALLQSGLHDHDRQLLLQKKCNDGSC